MTTGLRERKKQATRAALHEAALRLVAEHGLDQVSVDDIAADAEVSPRTFFNYFPSKDDAVIGLDPGQPVRLVDALSARPAAETPVQALRSVQAAEAERMAAEPELWPLRLQVVETHPVLAARLTAVFVQSEQLVAEWLAARTGTRAEADVQPTLLAAVQGSVMRTALHRWRAGGYTASLPALVAEGWDQVEAGFPAPHR